jgi:hypothetical protein
VKLSPHQIKVLREALERPVITRRSEIPNGVYRSLVVHELLMINRFGYSITPDGYDAIQAIKRAMSPAP